MSEQVIIALLALAGTAIGSLGGIRASGRLTPHRIDKLEAKVDKHNNMMERLYRVEERCEEQMRRLDEIKAKF